MTLVLKRQPRPLRVLHGSVSSDFFALYKPAAVLPFSRAALMSGEPTGPDDVQDSLLGRCTDARPADAAACRFPLLDEWYSRGVVPVAAAGPAAGLIAAAAQMGGVRRVYHVLCRVPPCLAPAGPQPGADLANPRVRQSVEDRARAQLAAEPHGPLCLPRCPLVTSTLVHGGQLQAQGTLTGTFVPQARCGQSERVSSRVAGLFTPKGGTACPDEGCPAQRWSPVAPHPYLAPDHFVVPGTGRLGRRAHFDVRVVGHTSGRALLEASTVDGTEVQLRAALAFGLGMPAIGDPVYDRTTVAALTASEPHPGERLLIERGRPAGAAELALHRSLLAGGMGPGVACTRLVLPDPTRSTNYARLQSLQVSLGRSPSGRDTVGRFEAVTIDAGVPASLLAMLQGDDPERSEEHPTPGPASAAVSVPTDAAVASPASREAVQASLLGGRRRQRCRYCSGDHPVTQCPKLQGADTGITEQPRPGQRWEERKAKATQPRTLFHEVPDEAAR